MKQRMPGRVLHVTLTLLAIMGLALSGCAPAATTPAPVTASEARGDGFTAKETPVFREELTKERTTLRFYDDMPNVAYVSFADFYKLLLPQGSADVTMQQDGTWRLETHTGANEGTAMANGRGGTAVANVAAGTLETPNLAALVNTMSNVQDGMDNVYFDGAPFVRVANVEYDKPADSTTIDFGKYGIAMHGDDDGLWLPVHALSALFSNLHYDYVVYNGQKLYVNGDNDMNTLTERDPGAGDAYFEKAERPDDMISFDYGLLCFVFDKLYGKPECAPNDLKSQGLDAYLASLGDDRKVLKDALNSKDYAVYLHGCDGLGGLIAQDGHTAIDFANTTGLDKSKAHEDLFKRYKALGEDENDPINRMVREGKEYNESKDIIQLSCKAESQKVYGDATYVSKGDTAMIRLDSVDEVDYEGWENYLAGKGPRPSATEGIENESSGTTGGADSVAIFLDGLDKARADPAVRNVVIDVSKNDGGSDDVVMFVTSIIANTAHEHFQNTLTGQMVTESFDVDRNLDGTFDQRDAEVSYDDLNFAMLTSGYCYSCGNQLPSLLKDAGVPTIGEKTDGGSCSVQKQVTGEGMIYNHSSWLSRLVNDAGQEIDFGVPVDVDLLARAGSTLERRAVEFGGKRLEADVYDYSSLFDLDNLSQVMNEIYASRA